MEKFKSLGLSDEMIKALEKKGFEEPTAIQEMTIPIFINETTDIIGQAQTGTGKTAAFGIPILELIKETGIGVQALILAPTRELALQVADEINSLKGHKKLKVLPVYGGQSIDGQIRNLKRDADIVVGTPGRIIDHLERKSLDISKIKFMVLDEADEMLNMGFIDEVEKIFKATPSEKRVILFSATMASEILNIAKKYMREYKILKMKKESLTTNLTDQIYFEISNGDKFEALCRIIDIEQEFYGIIFCRTKLDVDSIASKLVDRGYPAEGLHGDISQMQREKVLGKFRNKKLSILVATDVAARGIDVNDLTHVINYSLPQDPESYVHRIGRTGRAGKEGTAITFISPDEYRKLTFITRITKSDIRKEELPGINQVIESKKKRIMEEILEIMESEDYVSYSDFAKEILTDNNAERIVASVLRYALEDELDEKNYTEIRKYSSSNVNMAGKSRLFIAMGRLDDMTPMKIIDKLKEAVDIESKDIREIKILDKFSFFTVPFELAEQILDAFKTKRGKSLVERAKESTGGSSGGNRDRSRDGYKDRNKYQSRDRRY